MAQQPPLDPTSLLQYLSRHFLELEQLARSTGLSREQLRQRQSDGLIPQASYRLALSLQCDSYFGKAANNNTLEYYPLSTNEWINTVRTLEGETAEEGGNTSLSQRLFSHFSQRYCAQLDRLCIDGARVTADMYSRRSIEREWQLFLEGTYGLCTHGRPEDVAQKELAVQMISTLLEQPQLTCEALAELKKAVDWLDASAAQFAPHEYERSSRCRYVDQVRWRYLNTGD